MGNKGLLIMLIYLGLNFDWLIFDNSIFFVICVMRVCSIIRMVVS